MIEQLTTLLRTDELTISLAVAAALFGTWLIREALESNVAALSYFPLLVVLAIACNYVAVVIGVAEPLSQLSFRESDAAESISSLSFTAFAIATGVAFGSVLVVRLQQVLARPVRKEQQEL